MKDFTWIDLLPAIIIGAEEDGENEQQQEEEQHEEQQEQEQEDKSEKDKDSGIHKALAAERKLRAAAEKRAKAAEKAEEDRKLAEKTEVEQAQTRLQAQIERNQKLASSLLQRDLNDAITKAANAQKFIDPDDAIAGVDRNLLQYEQDDDDPTQITIDLKTVEAAVKAVAAKKPHFLQTGTSDGDASGSGFGGSKGKKPDEEKKLVERYPSLG